MKYIKKKFFIAICSMFILANNSISALAVEPNTYSDPKVKATITITDPDTGRVWEWQVPASDLQVQYSSAMTSNNISNISLSDGELIDTAVVTVNAGTYLAATFGQSKTLTDNVILTTGLTYSYRSLGLGVYAVTLHTIYGSVVPQGLYYAGNKVAWYRHAGTGASQTFRPTTNSWSYATDKSEGPYSRTIPPYSAVECDVFVAGMEPMSRRISITCNLDLD